MAEHFYSSAHGEDTAVFMTYNVAQQTQLQAQPLPQAQLQPQPHQQPLAPQPLQQQQQQQLHKQHQQQQQQSLMALGPANVMTAPGNELAYRAPSGYYAAATAVLNNNCVDMNNNCNAAALQYYGNHAAAASNYNKMLAGSMMSKYAITGNSYLPTNAAPMINMNAHTATTASGVTLQQSQDNQLANAIVSGVAGVAGVAGVTGLGGVAGVGCHYANSNGVSSCYNRNRYMPYNHNRSCAAAAATASATNTYSHNATMSIPMSTAVSGAANITYPFQSFAGIYPNCYGTVATTAAPPTALPAPIGLVPNPVHTAAHYERGAANGKPKSATSTHAAVVTTFGAASTTTASSTISSTSSSAGSIVSSTPYSSSTQVYASVSDPSQTVTLQITNLDYSMDEAGLRNFLLNQLKPITPVVSLVFEGSSYAKVTVPDLYFAKQVVSNLHRKKIGHKRMVVSYTRDSSLTEINTLRCQVAGLLKDVPYYTLPMYKFRELFQSRFKTSISVLDLYKMQDICTINADNNEEKFISLQPELVNSLESSPLMEGLQHSVPYCTAHFKREQHKGWAEQDIEPLPNVVATIAEIQKIIYPLLKNHPGDIPVASLVHCIEDELDIKMAPNDNGVNLEHLICCVQGIQIQMNNFGIKILGWLKMDKENNANASGSGSSNGGGGAGAGAGTGAAAASIDRGLYARNAVSDPLYQVSREVIELIKMSPKSTMKFNRFIPAYHNHFGKQCRVADYGYTKLIELFEALATVVQIMGDGENRQITLTHRTQIRRFTSDLLRVLRAHGNKSILLSQLPRVFTKTQNRNFDVTDYGVCNLVDILDGLVNSNIVVMTKVENGTDILISIPKRKQTTIEVEKTCIFAGEMVELFRNAPQYTIFFQKFVRSYHYHFAYQCRLSDYGFLKLADLMEAINGVVEMGVETDEDKKIFLSPKVAQRVFAEQCEELIRSVTGCSTTCLKLEDVLKFHKKNFGYQIQPQTLGVKDIATCIDLLPYVEVLEKEDSTWIVCHSDDTVFRKLCYRACKYLLERESDAAPTNQTTNKDATNKESASTPIKKKHETLVEFIKQFNTKHNENLTQHTVKAMKHAIEIFTKNDEQYVRVSKLMYFIVKIVHLLEQRPAMLVSEIKVALECSITTTFKFGYPNLYTVLTAHKDIFTINISASQERSEVSLVPNCELRVSSGSDEYYFGALKPTNVKQKSARATRQPLSEQNNRSISNIQTPTQNNRCVLNDNTSLPNQMSVYRALNSSSNSMQQVPAKVVPVMLQQQQQQAHQQQQQALSTSKLYPTLQCANNANSTIYSNSAFQSSTLNSSASNLSCNKENSVSFNNSSNLFNVSFNTSNGSLSDTTVNMSHMTPMCLPTQSTIYPPYNEFTSKLWDCRNSTFYQHHSDANNTASGLPPFMLPQQQTFLPLSAELNEPSNLYELNNNVHMYPMYDPPKPDTPPSDNMPFWIDPIWTNHNDTATSKNNLLNIKLPELKSFNVVPMVLSPYTISKNENMKQQVFNFDNHDRKIA